MKHDKKKQWLSIGLLTLGAAALAVFAAATLDAGDVRASLAALLPGWTAAIVGCMLLYYLCDALKYQLITRAFGCAQPLGDSIDTSMIGFFYSAVTPAAAGGQPFQVLHMHHRGIPTGTATSVICTTYCLWNVALVTLGIVGMCLCGGKLAAQSAAWIPVLALGLLVHAGLLTLVLLSAIFPKPMSAFGTACIRWLYRAARSSAGARTPRRPPGNGAASWRSITTRSPPASGTAASSPARSRLHWGSARRTCRSLTARTAASVCTACRSGRSRARRCCCTSGRAAFPCRARPGASEGTFYLAFSPLFGDYLTTAMLIWRLASYYLTIVLATSPSWPSA